MPDPERQFRLITGNCLRELPKISDTKVNLIFADPPYHLSNGGISVHSGKAVSVNKGEWDISRGFEADTAFHHQWIRACSAALADDGVLAISGTLHSIFRCGFALEALNFKLLNDIIWYKPNAAPHLLRRRFAAAHETILVATKSNGVEPLFNYETMRDFETKDRLKNVGKQMRDVWSISTTPKREKSFGRHPTQKPLELLERIVSAYTRPGDLVLDPFSGSGTTGVAAVKLGRRYIGIERDANFNRLARKRIREVLNDQGR